MKEIESNQDVFDTQVIDITESVEVILVVIYV